MKYIFQFGIILLISLLGELLNYIIPLPIPAGIYGIVILFLCLELKLIPLSAVKDVSSFLVGAMQIMFIPAGVGLLSAWKLIRPNWLSYIAITVVSTFAVMLAAGWSTQAVIRRKVKEESHE